MKHYIYHSFRVSGNVMISLCLISEAPSYEDVWGSGRIDLPFFISALMEVKGQFHAPAALPAPGKKPSTYWISGPQSRSISCGVETNILASTGNLNMAVRPVGRRYND
jgi:hypothetical protein